MALRRRSKALTAFSFLYLRSPENTRELWWYQWGYPTVVFFLAAVVVILLTYFGDRVLTLDKNGLVGTVNYLMGILVGFYIAALAAVSSFQNENLDQEMKGRTPILTTVRNGCRDVEKLTRRRFLAIIFGYCAILAVILHVLGAFLAHVKVSESASDLLGSVVELVLLMVWCVYAWIVCSLLVVTILGLHYLVERMHRP